MGIDRILTQLQAARLIYVGFVVLAVIGWLGAWSLALRTVLESLDIPLSVPRAFTIFSGATFANNVTPFGQAGGEPITAWLLSDASEATYEQGLAAIASVDTLNFVPSITLAVFGLGYYATLVTFSRKLKFASLFITVLAGGIPILIGVVWRYRNTVQRRLVSVSTSVCHWVSSLPRLSVAVTSVEQRVETFFAAIERIGSTRRQLFIALGFSTLGWLCQTVALWLAFHAVGTSVPLLQLFFVTNGGLSD